MRVDVKGNPIESDAPTEILCSNDILLVKGGNSLLEFMIDEDNSVDIDIKEAVAIIKGLQLAIDLGWFNKLEVVYDYRGADAE